MIDYTAARLNMVESQLRTTKVTDEAVLASFLAVPRERFVPAHLRSIAYIDEDIPLGGGRYLMEPRVLARLLQLAAPGKSDKVLHIGCATGYATALLARMAASTVAVECEPRLAAEARALLAEFGNGTSVVVEGRLEAGCPERAPYDVILIDGAVAAVPETISSQLAEGGRLVGVVKPGAGMGRATVMTRAEGMLSHRPVFDAATPYLPGMQSAPSFVF